MNNISLRNCATSSRWLKQLTRTTCASPLFHFDPLGHGDMDQSCLVVSRPCFGAIFVISSFLKGRLKEEDYNNVEIFLDIKNENEDSNNPVPPFVNQSIRTTGWSKHRNFVASKVLCTQIRRYYYDPNLSHHWISWQRILTNMLKNDSWAVQIPRANDGSLGGW